MSGMSPTRDAVSCNDVVPSERGFRDLLDRLPLIAFHVDLAGRLLYVNRAGLDAHGYTEADLARGVTAAELVAPEDREQLATNLRKRVMGQMAEPFVYRVLRKDGSTFPGLVHASVVSKDGRPDGLQGYVVDISDRMRVEEVLRHKVGLVELIMRISSRLVAGSDPRQLDKRIDEALAELGRFMDVDRSYLFSFSQDGAFMSNTHEWVAEGISAERKNLQGLATAEHCTWFLHELRDRGVVQVPEVAALPDEAATERAEFEREGIRSLVCAAMVDGEKLVGFLGLDAVRRARTWSEEELCLLRMVAETLMGAIARQRSEQALRQSESKYKALVETTATGFVILDLQGHVLDANAEYVRMTGHRTLDEIRGRSVVEWTAAHDRVRNAKAVAACLREGVIRDLQVEYACDDGRTVPVLINASVTEKDGGQEILSIVRDLTERRALEAERFQSEKLRSVGVLAGGIAHDFNNILTAILGNTSLLQTTLAPDGHALTLLSELEQATLRARELTHQLLTFSCGGEPVRRPFPPEALLRESASLALRGRATSSELHIQPDLRSIDGDEGQIAQVVRNLVLNASQAMEGSGTVVIRAENRQLRHDELHGLAAGHYVAIAISDRGCGISEEHRSRIFDPYFTTKRDGRGLGLAVSHSVVNNHKGTIQVASRPGGGAVFTVLLPAVDGVPASREQAAPTLGVGRGRILLMDDEESVRQIGARMATALGYDVAVAREGGEAVAMWRRAREQGEPFKLAIMDLTVLGGMGGQEAMRELLALEPGARVVVSSGYSHDPVMANFRQHGFREVLAKPYSVSEMSRVLSAVLAD